MQGSKIRLSPAEAALFSDAQIILTKNSIIQKTVALLTGIQGDLQEQAGSFILQNSPAPKISKGENYLGLPYVILDYPRISNNAGICFIRSMFWWGNFFSSTLQLSGQHKLNFTKQIKHAYELLKAKHYYVGVNSDPWVHYFEDNNYKKISGLSADAFDLILEESAHIKIAACWPLKDWDSAANKLTDSWKILTGLIT